MSGASSAGRVNETFTIDDEESTKTEATKNVQQEDDDDDDDDKKQTTTVPDLAPVSFFTLFRFASGLDLFLMIVAVICACGTGVCLPIMMILFGDVTDALVNSDAAVAKDIAGQRNVYSCSNSSMSFISLANLT